MKKGFKVALNLLGAAGIGAGGYFVGYRRGIKRLNEVIEYYDQKEATQEQIVSEVLVKPEDLKPELLEKMEYGKEDEVIIDEEDDLVEEEPEKEEVPFDIPEKVEEKPKKRSRKKAPYFIDEQTFAEEAGDVGNIIELEIDDNGDVYSLDSDDIYEEWTRLGTTIVNKMVKDHNIDKVDQWYVRDERDDVYYDITYRK